MLRRRRIRPLHTSFVALNCTEYLLYRFHVKKLFAVDCPFLAKSGRSVATLFWSRTTGVLCFGQRLLLIVWRLLVEDKMRHMENWYTSQSGFDNVTN